jgi:hypothetical protein
VTKTLHVVAARIASQVWGGRWTTAEPQETREPGSFPGSKGSRAQDNDAERTA